MSTQKVEDTKNDEAKNNAEDLALDKSKSEDVKGGPAYMKFGDIKGEVQPRNG